MSLAVEFARGRAFFSRKAGFGPAGWIALYGLVWGSAALSVCERSEVPLAGLAVLVLTGVVLPLIAWALTRRAEPAPIPVERPWRELGALGAYLVLYATVGLGFGFGLVHAWLARGRAFELVMLDIKLVLGLMVPLGLLALLGAGIRPLLAPRFRATGAWATYGVLAVALILVDAFATASLPRLDALHPTGATLAWAAPACFAWVALQGGLCEEVLFRAALQSRLAAALKSETGAVILGAFAFALTHAAGVTVRPELLAAGGMAALLPLTIYTIALLTPVGLLFGVVWARTRSLGLLILLHATIDFLPNLPEFIRTWA